MIRSCKVTQEEFPKRYLQTFNGILGLTESELDLSAVIIGKYLEFGRDGLREPFLSKFVFSTDGRESIKKELDNISNQNLGNKLKQLVEKGVLTQDGRELRLENSLLPQPEVIFRFIVEDEQQTSE